MTLYSIFGILGAVALLITGIRYFLNRSTNLFISFFQNFVGVVFIFSGFIKANDPLGFGYKLEEYYQVFAEATQTVEIVPATTITIDKPVASPSDSLTAKTDSVSGPITKIIPATTKAKDTTLSSFFLWLKGSAAIQSIFICIIEIVLGFILMLGARKKWTLLLLSFMIIFFTFLTFYSAYFNKVTDCGCFGDFMHITPWTSFIKDIILLAAIAILVFGRKHITPLLTSRPENISIGIFTLIATIFPFYTWSHLPIMDFRPYKVGTNIIEAMKVPPGGEGKFETTVYYKNLQTGEVKGFKSTEKYPWDDTLHWKQDRQPETKTLVEPILAPIHDFSIYNLEGSEYTEDILAAPGPKFLLVCRDLSETKRNVFGQVNDFADLCAKDGVMFIGLTASSKKEVDTLQKQTKFKFEFYVTDNTQLKTMIRSNPGLVLLDGAVVKAMWPASALPSYNEVKDTYFKKK